MRRVSQSRIVQVDERGIIKPDSPGGDCFPACIASIFEIPLEMAPGQRGNMQEVWNWLALNYVGIGAVSRDWVEARTEAGYRAGYWIAAVESSRFREPDCHRCTTDRRRKSDPPFVWRRDECPNCGGTGEAFGLHAVVMEHRQRVWDPHPDADWDAPLRYRGETYFTVTDPSRLVPRALPVPLGGTA